MSTDLPARVAAAERRLVEREQRLRQRWNDLGQHLRQATQPRRLAGPLLGGAALILLVWLIGQRRRASAPAVAGSDRPLLARVPWLQLGAMALPLLPPPWRERLQPSSLSGMLLRAFRHRRDEPVDAPPRPVDHVDLNRYAGAWHEIARIPNRYQRACAGQPSATYLPRGDDIVVVNRCRTRSGRLRVSEGVAQVVAGSGGARLKLSFAPAWLRGWHAAWADYWILDLDDDYQVALVGTPRRDALWLLARQPSLDDAQRTRLLHAAAAQGYDPRRLRFN